MKDKIIKIILERIGEDAKDPRLDNKQYVPKTEIELIQISKAVARNQTLAELRAKSPDLAEKIIKEVVGEMEKEISDLRAEHANTARHGNDPDSAYDRVESLLWNYINSLTKEQ